MKGVFLYKKVVTATLILSFVVPATFLVKPTKTHALEGDYIGGPANIINVGFSALSAASDAISSAALSSLVFKEYALDSLVVIIRETLIKSITASIVNWINNGFEGEPAFITDLEGFMLDVADQVAGEYIQGSALAFLCSPFSIDVKIALALDYYSSTQKRTSCTLTGAIQNVQDAFGGFKDRSGWDAWFDLTVNPNNNPLGSFLSARADMQAAIRDARGREVVKLGWGNGFKSYEICDEQDAASGATPVFSGSIGNARINCTIATPGTLINDKLSEALGTGYRQLELADEINEIIGALLGQLTKQVLGGSESGLSGLSSSSYNTPSYTDQLLQESPDTSSVAAKTIRAIDTNIEYEDRYRSAKQTSENAVKDAVGTTEALRQCYASKAGLNQTLWSIPDQGSGELPISFSSSELSSLAESASSTIHSTLLPLQFRLGAEIEKVEAVIKQILTVKEGVGNVQSADALSTLLDEFQGMQQNGQLHSLTEVLDAELERDGYPGENHNLAKGIVRDMKKLTTQASKSLKTCENLTTRQFQSNY